MSETKEKKVKKVKEETKEVKAPVLIKAEAKTLRITPMKVNRILKLIRGKKAVEGLTILQFLPHSAARYVEKVLKSAVANAEHNNKLNRDGLVIAEAVANSGTLLKRWRAGGKGRAQRIKKYTSHIRIVVKEGR